jgi:hypothetical protein
MPVETHNDERKSDLAVLDANEYKQKRRLERILDTLDEVEHTANEAWDLLVAGEITHKGKDIMIQRAVKEAIRECYNLLHNYARDDETDGQYWSREGAETPLGVIEQQTRDDVEIQGLRDFLRSETVYREEEVQEVKPRNMPGEVRTELVERSVPETVSFRAFLMLKRFLAVEHDLEITFEDVDDSPLLFSFDTVDLSELNVEQIQYIEKKIESSIDARALTDGENRDDE